MAALRGEYDDYNRRWPKVFVGEYAARDKNHRSAAPLRSAIAEAAFLLGLERNADVVEASAFAPLLEPEVTTRSCGQGAGLRSRLEARPAGPRAAALDRPRSGSYRPRP